MKPMKLKIKRCSADEIFTDTVRIPAKHRSGIENGSVVRITHGTRHIYAILRGLQDRNYDNAVLMDEFLRRKLGVQEEDEIDSKLIRKATEFEKFIWHLNATNPAVYVPARVAIWLLLVGLLAPSIGAWIIVKFGQLFSTCIKLL